APPRQHPPRRPALREDAQDEHMVIVSSMDAAGCVSQLSVIRRTMAYRSTALIRSLIFSALGAWVIAVIRTW
ncbi:hypothetical protein ACH419_43440, partial [Streptomyces bobili]|uniref:hypothetical protein n=1 Tax=Streptomyces bobili TaxID=67280 RepID=UPI00379B4D0C